MARVVITGWRSKIAEEFRNLLPDGEIPVWGKPLEPDNFPCGDRYLFCHGLLRPKRLDDQTQAERDEGWLVNYISIATRCDMILRAQPGARICIIGSESGYRDSFDGVYANAKAALHRYIEGVPIKPFQQIVGISPGIIDDCGMTTRRTDTGNLKRRLDALPKRRFLKAAEVAKLAHHLLYEQDYITGTVIRMHGGLK